MSKSLFCEKHKKVDNFTCCWCKLLWNSDKNCKVVTLTLFARYAFALLHRIYVFYHCVTVLKYFEKFKTFTKHWSADCLRVVMMIGNLTARICRWKKESHLAFSRVFNGTVFTLSWVTVFAWIRHKTVVWTSMNKMKQFWNSLKKAANLQCHHSNLYSVVLTPRKYHNRHIQELNARFFEFVSVVFISNRLYAEQDFTNKNSNILNLPIDIAYIIKDEAHKINIVVYCRNISKTKTLFRPPTSAKSLVND